MYGLNNRLKRSTLIDISLYHEPYWDKLSAEKLKGRTRTYDKIIFVLAEKGPLTEYRIHKETRISRNNVILAKRLRVLKRNNVVFEHSYSLPTPITKNNSRGAYTWMYYMLNGFHPLARDMILNGAFCGFNPVYESSNGESDNKIIERIRIIEDVSNEVFGNGLLASSFPPSPLPSAISPRSPSDKLYEYRSQQAELNNKIGYKAIELVKTYKKKLEELDKDPNIIERAPLDVFIHLTIQGIIPDKTYKDFPYTYFDLWRKFDEVGLLEFTKSGLP